MDMSRERSDEVAHFVQRPLSIRSPGLQTQDSLNFIAYRQATYRWGDLYKNCPVRKGDVLVNFVQGPLSIRSPELQTLDSLTLWLIDKLRIAGGGQKMGMSRERSDEVVNF